MIPFILGALAAVGLSELSKRNKPKMVDGGGVGKSYLHLFKLTYPDGQYRVESYDGKYMPPNEAMQKMKIINLRGLKSYKYKGVSSDSEQYKQWFGRKDIGYSNTEAWDEIFEGKYAKGGDVKGGKIGEYRVIGIIRFADDEKELNINETILAISNNDAISKIKKRYIGIAPDSDLFADIINE
jgi:hypothetical protein